MGHTIHNVLHLWIVLEKNPFDSEIDMYVPNNSSLLINNQYPDWLMLGWKIDWHYVSPPYNKITNVINEAVFMFRLRQQLYHCKFGNEESGCCIQYIVWD